MGNYRELEVWRRGHALTLSIYRLTARLPAEEKFGLVSQMRRAAASIPTNVAEGCGRNSDSELARYCRIALGSANELDYQILLATDFGLLPADHLPLADDLRVIRRMLASLVARLGGTPGE